MNIKLWLRKSFSIMKVRLGYSLFLYYIRKNKWFFEIKPLIFLYFLKFDPLWKKLSPYFFTWLVMVYILVVRYIPSGLKRDLTRRLPYLDPTPLRDTGSYYDNICTSIRLTTRLSPRWHNQTIPTTLFHGLTRRICCL